MKQRINDISGGYLGINAGFGSGWGVNDPNSNLESFRNTISHLKKVLSNVPSGDPHWGNKGIKINDFFFNSLRLVAPESPKEFKSLAEFDEFLKLNGVDKVL